MESSSSDSTSQAAQGSPRPERKATLRLGQRELSLISFTVILIIVGLGIFGMYRVFLNFKSHRDIVIGNGNLLNLWKAFQGYKEDWDGRLPPAEGWTENIKGYLSAPPGTPGGQFAALRGPGDGSEPVGYVYNTLAAGYNLDRPELNEHKDRGQIVLLIERPGTPENATVTIPPQDSAQAEDALVKELAFPHYSDDTRNATTLILYADGNIRRMKRIDFGLK